MNSASIFLIWSYPLGVILEARRIDIIRYLNFYFNHSWFENNKSIMMCKGGIAILNYGCVPSITNQSSRYNGLVTVCYKFLQQNERSVQFSRNETILQWIDLTEMSTVSSSIMMKAKLLANLKLGLLYLFSIFNWFGWFMVLNATLNNISVSIYY